jgi:hypothetical protein
MAVKTVTKLGGRKKGPGLSLKTAMKDVHAGSKAREASRKKV